MSETFKVGGQNFELSASGKARALEAHITETGRMLSTLGTIIDRLERAIPETMSSKTVGPDIRRVVREELVNAVSLLVEIAEHTEMSAEQARGVVDNAQLSEEAQAVALHNTRDLDARYDAMKKRLENFSRRFGMRLP